MPEDTPSRPSSRASVLLPRPPASSTWQRPHLHLQLALRPPQSRALILRLDDTDVERNSEASVQSIFEGLRWLGLSWDEEYKQSERLALHARPLRPSSPRASPIATSHPPIPATTPAFFSRRMLFNPSMRELSKESPTAAPPPRALRPPLSHPPWCRANLSLHRLGLRRAIQTRR